jgi:hypothetical protein
VVCTIMYTRYFLVIAGEPCRLGSAAGGSAGNVATLRPEPMLSGSGAEARAVVGKPSGLAQPSWCISDLSHSPPSDLAEVASEAAVGR